MNPVEIIRKKRDGRALDAGEIGAFVRGVTDGSVPDYQAAALLMAIYWRGLDGEELTALTDAMLHSGDVLDLSDLGLQKVDKHSTGGVGDKISLHLAPAVAACGVAVPMISGRGLGHTGGTLDKLESIPGFDVNLDESRFRRVLRDCGLALIGQTERLAPADKKLYALRDVTGTVESIPLIAASIMSKKLAEGIDGLVLDVKVGSGAFMKTPARARALAETLVDIGRRAGRRVSAFLTDMNQPLGRMVGNAAEVHESLEVLRGRGEPDLVELTLALGGEMLLLGRAVRSYEEGRARIAGALADGSALERFERCVTAQGGTLPTSTRGWLADDMVPVVLPASAWSSSGASSSSDASSSSSSGASSSSSSGIASSPSSSSSPAPSSSSSSSGIASSGSSSRDSSSPAPSLAAAGFVIAIDAEQIGLAALALGAGRTRKEDAIDHGTYVRLTKKVGERVEANEPVAHFSAPRRGDVAATTARVRAQIAAAYRIGAEPPPPRPLIIEVIR